MKKLLLIVAMALITSFASAQITFEQFNQINFKVTPQQLTEQLLSKGFVQNNSGVITGQINNIDVEISFTLSENGVINQMQVTELQALEGENFNQRVREVVGMINESGKDINLQKDSPQPGKARVILIYR
jgi:hypothetical protein